MKEFKLFRVKNTKVPASNYKNNNPTRVSGLSLREMKEMFILKLENADGHKYDCNLDFQMLHNIKHEDIISVILDP